MFPGWRSVTAADPGLRCATVLRLRVIPQLLPANRLVHGFHPACKRVDLLSVDLHGILIHRHRGEALGRIEQCLDKQHFFRGAAGPRPIRCCRTGPKSALNRSKRPDTCCRVDDHQLTLAGENGPTEGPFVRTAEPGGLLWPVSGTEPRR